MISILLLGVFILNKYNSLNDKIKEAVNYLIVGVLTTVVSVISYNIFRFVISNYLICTILSWVVAVLFAYITNRKYVFRSNEKNIVKEFVEFIFSRLLSLLAEVAIMYVLVDFLTISDRISKLIVQVIIIILNYVFSKLFVFRK